MIPLPASIPEPSIKAMLGFTPVETINNSQSSFSPFTFTPDTLPSTSRKTSHMLHDVIIFTPFALNLSA